MGEYIPRFEQRDGDARTFGHARLGTGGAIPVKNDKGEITMQKVKVQRYMAGKIPAFAQNGESDSDFEEEGSSKDNREEKNYRRHNDERPSRFDRHVEEPQIIRKEDSSDEDEDKLEERRARARARRMEMEDETETRRRGDEDEGEESEEEKERRRRMIKERQLRKEKEQLLLKTEVKEDLEGESEEEEEESEYTSSEESEEDDVLPRLKPVFVRKKDRVTLMEAEKEQKRMEMLKIEESRRADEKKRESARMVNEILKEEEEAAKRNQRDEHDLSSVLTDDENEEMAYEEWKLREMKRLKRNRDERETAARERAELERVHSMTEEERRAYMRANPKIITNKADKGKYKFLQKYYHRGAFFLDEDDDVYKRNFNEATLEDRFDKTVLPKVMQVKNFGQASRSKWTHLTNEDTTDHQGTWATPNTLNVTFFNKQAAGMKQTFERPAAKKRRNN